MKTTLPIDSKERKLVPIYSGFLAYFPAAVAGAAAVSQAAMKQHNLPKLGHDRTKSADHADCVPRHMLDVGDLIAALERNDAPAPELRARILAEASSAVWRVCAWSQELHERYGSAPMAPAAYTVPSPPLTSEEKGVQDVPAFLRPSRQV